MLLSAQGLSLQIETIGQNRVTSKTTQLAEDLTLEEFGSDQAQLARELAGRIQQLHDNKSPVKTDTGHSTPAKPAAQRMTFNPLHPSMELPPEQLIRLMGMHAQQLAVEARKHKPDDKTSIADGAHSTTTSPARIRLEYSDAFEAHSPFKWTSMAVFILVCIGGYFATQQLPQNILSAGTWLHTKTLAIEDFIETSNKDLINEPESGLEATLVTTDSMDIGITGSPASVQTTNLSKIEPTVLPDP